MFQRIFTNNRFDFQTAGKSFVSSSDKLTNGRSPITAVNKPFINIRRRNRNHRRRNNYFLTDVYKKEKLNIFCLYRKKIIYNRTGLNPAPRSDSTPDSTMTFDLVHDLKEQDRARDRERESYIYV